MRTGILMVGIIFLIIGAVLYFVPLQAAAVTTTGEQVRTSTASVQIPRTLAYIAGAIGVVLTVLGLAMPSAYRRSDEPVVVETTERIVSGNGRKKTVIHKREEHKGTHH